MVGTPQKSASLRSPPVWTIVWVECDGVADVRGRRGRPSRTQWIARNPGWLEWGKGLWREVLVELKG